MWQPRARANGFDPKAVRDATKRDQIMVEIVPKDMRGCVIGDPERCVGAKRLKKVLEASWVWMGVTVAIVGWENGKLVRYKHNGKVPHGQDGGFFVKGIYRFGAVPKHDQTGARSERRRKDRPLGGKDKVGDGSRRAKTYEYSPAAQMRH